MGLNHGCRVSKSCSKISWETFSKNYRKQIWMKLLFLTNLKGKSTEHYLNLFENWKIENKKQTLIMSSILFQLNISIR